MKNLNEKIENNRDEIIEKMKETVINSCNNHYVDYHVCIRDLNNEELEIFIYETTGNECIQYFTIYSVKSSEEIGDYLEQIIEENEEYETIEEYVNSFEYETILNDILDEFIKNIKENPELFD